MSLWSFCVRIVRFCSIPSSVVHFIRIGSVVALLSLLVLSPAAVVLAQDTVPADDSVEAAGRRSKELLVFDVNRKVTKKDRGFPRNDPPRRSANKNWRSPVNFAQGTLYYRVEIRNQPQAQNMRLQFCVWQDRFRLENCGSQKRVRGTSGTVVTWSQPVNRMWKKGGRSIDWSRPRQRYGIAIKDSRGKPVSDYNGWRWNGHNPNKWYPLNMRFTVVVVAKGSKFSGWQNYGGRASDNALTDADMQTVDAALVESTADNTEVAAVTVDSNNDALNETENLVIISEDGSVLDFGSGMDDALWEAASATDAVDIDDDADTDDDANNVPDVDEELDNKLYLPLIIS